VVNGEQKVTSFHRERLAVVYLRQSSMAQVREHTESTMRQYGLAGEAERLGGSRSRTAESPAPAVARPQTPPVRTDRVRGPGQGRQPQVSG
jgi:hypothetical protein